MLNPLKVKQEIDRGVSPVCATCTWWHKTIDFGLSNCADLHKGECGGPIGGNDFPLYDGPMSQLDKHCFACIKSADFVIKPVAKTRFIGVCLAHLGMVDRFVKQAANGKAIVEVRSPKGLVLPSGDGWYTEKTLVDHLAEDEAGNG